MNLLWLQSGGCGGCSMSLLCADTTDFSGHLKSAGIDLLWHPSLSLASGSDVIALLQSVLDGHTRLDALCVEGSLLRGPNGTGRFHMLAGTGLPMILRPAIRRRPPRWPAGGRLPLGQRPAGHQHRRLPHAPQLGDRHTHGAGRRQLHR